MFHYRAHVHFFLHTFNGSDHMQVSQLELCFQGTSQIAQAATVAQLALCHHSAQRLLAVAGAITPVAIV